MEPSLRAQRTSEVVASHITKLWQHLLAASGSQDPGRTLLPADGPSEQEMQALEPAKPAGHAAAVETDAIPASGVRQLDSFKRRYRIIRQLDEGGMGSVYLAWHHALAREVAVKLLRRDAPTRRLLFRAEALVTAYLEHPNIVPVYDAADDCLVMRHVRGASLDRVIAAGGAMTMVVEMILHVCDAIAFAHSRGIIHRDIKAENVMVGEYGEVLVVDWGLALAFRADPDGVWRAPRRDRCPSVCAGTPGCLPPEVARGETAAVGSATDVHMLGGLLYFALSGRLPFEAPTSAEALQRALCNDWQPLAEVAPGAPHRLASICEMAMATEPDHRPTVAAFAGELRAWLARAAAREAGETGAFVALGARPPTGWLHGLLRDR